MAQALAKGFIAGGVRKKSEIFASAPKSDIQSVEEFRKLGCRVVHDNREILDKSDVVILAVKPQVMPDVLSEINSHVSLKNLMVSIALGVPLSTMEEVLPMGSRIVRVMSNTPVIVSEGASVFSLGAYAGHNDAETISELFSSVGICERVPESSIDAVTGLSGSGPAYCYLAIEALADGGVMQGLPRDMALKLAAQTLLGAAKMVLESNRHPGALKDDVCSPAGCTIAAVAALEKSGFRSSLIDAVSIATMAARAMAADQTGDKVRSVQRSDKLSMRSTGGKKVVLNNILQ